MILRKRRSISCDQDGPSPKKSKDVDLSEHRQKISLLKDEMKKKTPKSKHIKELMADTWNERRQWMVEECPSVQEVVTKYPPLRLQRWVGYIHVKGLKWIVNLIIPALTECFETEEADQEQG